MCNRNFSIFLCFACMTFLIFIMIACLWEYRIWVGLSLLVLLFLIVSVFLRGIIKEQNLRSFRFNHHEETLLEQYPEPYLTEPKEVYTCQDYGYQQIYQPYQHQ